MPWQVYNSAGQLLQATDLPDNAVTNAKVADDAVGVAELSATGTASSSTFLRGDNAWVAAGGLSAASQAEMEAASSNTVAATPGRTQNHPGVAKVWVKWEQSGAHGIIVSHNMTSVTDGSQAGDTDHVFATDFSGTNYVVVTGGGDDNRIVFVNQTTYAAGTLTTVTREASSAGLNDASNNMMAIFGDQ